MPETSSDVAIAREVRTMGREVSARQVRELRDRGVIASGGKGGRGKMTTYPPGTVDVVAAMADAYRDSGLFHRAVLIAWWRGTAIGDTALRRSLSKQLRQLGGKAVRAAAGSKMPGSDYLGDALPRVPRSERGDVMSSLSGIIAGTGREDISGPDVSDIVQAIMPSAINAVDTVRASLPALFDQQSSYVASSEVRDALFLLDFTKASILVRSVERAQLDQERDELRQVLPTMLGPQNTFLPFRDEWWGNNEWAMACIVPVTLGSKLSVAAVPVVWSGRPQRFDSGGG